jgi:hypothetical protein
MVPTLSVLCLASSLLCGSALAEPIIPVQPVPIAQALAENMDGRTFAVDFGLDGKSAAGKDVIRFEDGKMSTQLCIKFGFEPAPYLLRVEGNSIYFHAEMESAAQGMNVFDGRIENGVLKAHAKWAQPRWYWTVHVNSWFEGPQADPKAELPAFLN